MSKILALLLFLITVPFAFACEDELTLHPLTQVIVAAVDQGFAPMDKVQRWVGRRGQGNPLVGLALQGKGLSYRQGIQRLLSKVSPQTLAQIQSQLEKRTRQHEQKDQARENVRQIVSPTEITEWKGGTGLAWSPPEAGLPMLALVNSAGEVEIRRPFEKGAKVHRFTNRISVYMPQVTWGMDNETGKLKLWILDTGLIKRIFVGDLSSSMLNSIPVPNLREEERLEGWITVTGMSPLLISRSAYGTSEKFRASSLSPDERNVYEADGHSLEYSSWLRDKSNQLLVLHKASTGVQVTNTSGTDAQWKFPITESGKALRLFETRAGRVLAIFQKDRDKILIRAPFEKGFRQIKVEIDGKIWGAIETIEIGGRFIMAVPFMYDDENGELRFAIAAYEPLLSNKPIWAINNIDSLGKSLKMWMGNSKSLYLGISVGDNHLLVAEPLAQLTYPLLSIKGGVESWVENQGQMYFTTADVFKDKHILYRVMK